MDNERIDNSTEEILARIKAGLTGDAKVDIPYLGEQMKKYGDEDFENKEFAGKESGSKASGSKISGREIAKACSQMMFDLMSEAEKDQAADDMMDAGDVAVDPYGFRAAIAGIHRKEEAVDYAGALEIVLELEERCKAAMPADDEKNRYYCFREFMEEALFRYFRQEQASGDILRPAVDFGEIYYQEGHLLNMLGRHDEAEAVLKKAKEWNPASTSIAFEYADTFKYRNRYEDFKKHTLELFRICYKPTDLAKAYRYFGHYLAERDRDDEAACCMIFSLNFDNSDKAQLGLYKIIKKRGDLFDPSMEQIQKTLSDNGLPYGPCQHILDVAYTYGKYYYDQAAVSDAANRETALYFLKIFDGLLHVPEVQEMITSLERSDK